MKRLVTEDEYLSARVEDGVLKFTRDNGEILNVGVVQGPASTVPGPAGKDGSNVLPTQEAILQEITEDGPVKDALKESIDEAVAGLSGNVLGGGVSVIGPTLPEGIPAGREYIWHKTDGQGNLLDIIVGIVPHPGVSTWEALAAQYATWEDIRTATYPTWESLTGTN